MIIDQNELFTLRSFEEQDASSLARYANNRRIWINLRDAFPNPYHIEHAQKFISLVKSHVPELAYGISYQDEIIGAIGYKQGSDVERISAEIGYWLGEPFWGKGIMTAVVQCLVNYIFTIHEVKRIFAVPFAWNTASHRVLEKAGFIFEGRMHCSAIKDGQVIDQLMYAMFRQ